MVARPSRATRSFVGWGGCAVIIIGFCIAVAFVCGVAATVVLSHTGFVFLCQHLSSQSSSSAQQHQLHIVIIIINHTSIIMFAGYHDDVDSPSEDDVGKFVTQKELNTWWKALQKKYPNVYPPNEVRFRRRLLGGVVRCGVEVIDCVCGG